MPPQTGDQAGIKEMGGAVIRPVAGAEIRGKVASIDSLRAAALRERTRYVLISSIEYRTRRVAQQLSSMTTPPPGWRRVFDSQGAVIYVVMP